MTQDPRTQDQIYRSIRDRLTSSIAGLTNFTERSFNYIFTQSYADELRELELQAVAARLSGYIDYADGNLDQDDLRELGIDDVVDDPDEINQYMSDDNLDALVEELGVSRRGGDFATGEAEFTTQSARTVIPEGTTVTTALDSDGGSLQFETIEEVVVPDGITVSPEVTIQAVESGEEYNLPEGEIVRVQSPPVGVTGVLNTNQTSGGTDIETNDELRARAKQAVPSSSLGGTTTGIRAFIRQNVEGVEEGDVIIDESVESTPPFVDVIVDGGSSSAVIDAIETSRPTGIQHNLVRAETITLGIERSLMGTGINESIVEEDISEYIGELNIGENFYRNELVRTILNADDNIINVEKLDTIIESVTEEKIVYNAGQDTYQLNFTHDDVNGEISIQDKSGTIYTQGDDFTVVDASGDGYTDSIQWVNGSPDDGEQFSVSYDVTVVGETLERDYYTASDVRDEPFVFNLNDEYVFEYTDNVAAYDLPSRPFDGTITVIEIDDNGDPIGSEFIRDESWQLAPLKEDGSEDTYTFDDTQSNYVLTDRLVDGGIAIRDETGAIYQLDTDYELVDTNSDGAFDEISWMDGAESPANGEQFTIYYGCCTQSIQWDQSSTVPTPSNGGTVQVTFDQKVYETEYEIVEAKENTIKDASGDEYEEGVDYQLYDATGDNEDDSILWFDKPSTLNDGETFYFSYVSEGDIFIDDRQKVSPGEVGLE